MTDTSESGIDPDASPALPPRRAADVIATAKARNSNLRRKSFPSSRLPVFPSPEHHRPHRVARGGNRSDPGVGCARGSAS